MCELINNSCVTKGQKYKYEFKNNFLNNSSDITTILTN